MKRKVLLVMLVLALVFSGATVLAWDPPSAGVEGKAQLEAVRNHGNSSTGGGAYGSASGEFKADGASAYGEADAEGQVRGRSFADESSAFSKSAARVSSSAFGVGDTAEIKVGGTASQANWGTVDRNDAGFISGGNYTESAYEDARNGAFPYSGGGASADGKTHLTATDISTRGVTKGNSEAWLASGYGDPVVKGEGVLAGGNALNHDGVSAVTTFDGTAKYGASGPEYAAGGLKISGQTELKETPGGVSLKSSVKAGSWATRQ